MIYLAERRLLFIKPKKTASTSFEIALSCNAGPGDIVTPLAPVDEALRASRGGRMAQNWSWLGLFESRYRTRFAAWQAAGQAPGPAAGPDGAPGRPPRLYARWQARYYNHIRPDQIARRGGGAMLRDGFVVAMVRHPYDLVVSYAGHMARNSGRPFEAMLDRALARGAINDAYLFGPRKPDFVIRFEHLSEDLAVLEQRFDLVLNPNMPFAKKARASDAPPARDRLPEPVRVRIREIHARSFAAFDYAP